MTASSASKYWKASLNGFFLQDNYGSCFINLPIYLLLFQNSLMIPL
jgi:hypothetical protein